MVFEGNPIFCAFLVRVRVKPGSPFALNVEVTFWRLVVASCGGSHRRKNGLTAMDVHPLLGDGNVNPQRFVVAGGRISDHRAKESGKASREVGTEGRPRSRA